MLSLALVACSGPSSDPVQQAPVVELPPPLPGAGAPPRVGPAEAEAIDPDDWELPDRASEPEHPPLLRLVYGQDLRAELDACGCPGSPTGGVARRVTATAELREVMPDVLVVEGPSALSRAVLGYETVRGDHRARGRLVLAALAASRPAAFFPGQADFAVVEPPELARRAANVGLPLVSTTLADGEGYRRWWAHEVDGRRVVLLGLTREAGTEDRRNTAAVLDAVPAAAAALADAAEQGPVDLVIAFTDGDLRDVGRWRSDGLDVDMILTRDEPSDDRSWYVDGGTHIVRADPLGRALRRVDVLLSAPGRAMSSGREPRAMELLASIEGNYVGLLRKRRHVIAEIAAGRDPREEALGPGGSTIVDPSTDPDGLQEALARSKQRRRQVLAELAALGGSGGHRVAVSRIVLLPEIPEDPAVRRQIDDFGAARLVEMQQTLDATPVPRGTEYVGKDACFECHPEATAHWAQTPHAEAWRTIVDRGEQNNPDCLGCHTTGFGEPGGFADPAAGKALVNVQCEACHGPMGLHVTQAGAGPQVRPDPGLPVREATCTGCHDPANSPRFDASSYYPTVAHPGAEPKLPDD